MADPFPLRVIAIDYVLGAVMWTLIGRAGMTIFLPEDSDLFFIRFFVRATDPVIRAFRTVMSGFLILPLVPLYVTWFFFMVRFYLMPALLGYSVMGMLAFRARGRDRPVDLPRRQVNEGKHHEALWLLALQRDVPGADRA